MRRLFFLIVCLILTGLLLSACGAKDTPERQPQQVSSVPVEQTAPVTQTQAEPDRESDAVQNEQSAVSNPLQQAPGEQPSGTKTPEVPKTAGGKTDTPKNYSLKVGGYFPPFSLSNLEGGTISSGDLFAGNTVTLINFWGTFCGPCIREMPELEKLWQQYSGQGLGVVGIILDSQKAAQARSIAAKLGTTYPHVLDDGRYGPGIRAVPMTLLVDSEGKVLVSVTGARTLPVFVQMIEPYL